MPPKKKKGKKKKKKKDGDELTIEDKYKQTLDEIEALKDHLTVRKELTRRSKVTSEEWKERMLDAENDLEVEKQDYQSVSADMTRQYKTMQTEMGLRIHQLETDLEKTSKTLEKTEADLKKTREEKDKIERLKNDEIKELQMKIDAMGMQYETVLNDHLDKLIEKIGGARAKWEDHSTMIQTKHKHILLDYGLNPQDI
ncbi:unnamed protein product [Owenia fusiformis]|uniref:Dynein regulatory complex protein 12 n=1 Tax=Owenia fusiformis TaxID=6347 RepID=A0A8J1XTR9_OWEFU|nr:unnamed protein product [Owenia fusiformis]